METAREQRTAEIELALTQERQRREAQWDKERQQQKEGF